MNTVLLPVKDFKDAKHRLAPALNTDQRAGLSRAMLVDVLDALSLAADPLRVVVYTASADVAAMVKPFGFEIVIEPSARGHSAAVNSMLPGLVSNAERVLVIASDLPRLQSDDINSALTARCAPVAIFPSRDGTGTNGIMVTAPSQFEVEYGPGSFDRHVERARSGGIEPAVIPIAGVAFDIDTPDDLRHFMEYPRLDSETWRFLKNAL